jgi:hypothetical protein
VENLWAFEHLYHSPTDFHCPWPQILFPIAWTIVLPLVIYLISVLVNFSGPNLIEWISGVSILYFWRKMKIWSVWQLLGEYMIRYYKNLGFVWLNGCIFLAAVFNAFYYGHSDKLLQIFRVLGDKVAEVPLVATRFHYRRHGMCRILMDELEKVMNKKHICLFCFDPSYDPLFVFIIIIYVICILAVTFIFLLYILI